MLRVIGQKSSSDKGADYAVITARPVWAERMLRSIGDDKLLQFEARFADHVSLQFAQADYNQQEREAAYAHFLHQHGGEVAAALRTELDKHAAETAAGMAAVMKKTGADITHMYAAAGQAFQGLGGDISTLRSQTESAVGDIKSTTATLSQDIAAAKTSIHQSQAQAQAHEQEIRRVATALSGASSEAKNLAAEVARQGAEIQAVGTEARKRAEASKHATDQLKQQVADLANKVEFEQERAGKRQEENANNNRATRESVDNIGAQLSATSQEVRGIKGGLETITEAIARFSATLDAMQVRQRDAEQHTDNNSRNNGDLAREAIRVAREASEGRQASEQRVEAAIQNAQALQQQLYQQQQHQQQQQQQHQQPQMQNPFPQDFFDNLAGSIANGLSNKKTDEDKEDLRSEHSDDDADTNFRRMEKRLKRLKFVAPAEKHFHAEAVLDEKIRRIRSSRLDPQRTATSA